MKLITAVIGKKDLNPVCDALREAGYSFTKIPTSGGFLRNSNMTLLIGVEDDKLAHAVELINQNCKSRTEQNEDRKARVGGATLFVTDVERFERCKNNKPPGCRRLRKNERLQQIAAAVFV